MNKYFILDGHKAIETDIDTWGKWFQNVKDRHVADETIEGVRISTVFLGLNHAFVEGSPLLFETLVFDGPLDGEMERYTTWEEAEEGHKIMVQRVKEALHGQD